MEEKGTTSFSLLIMLTTSCFSVNSSFAMPSKHFLRWGCTRVGSLVSDRISNSSSLDRKKNLRTYVHKPPQHGALHDLPALGVCTYIHMYIRMYSHLHMCTKACLVVKNEDCIILGINSSKLNSALTKYILSTYVSVRMYVSWEPFPQISMPFSFTVYAYCIYAYMYRIVSLSEAAMCSTTTSTSYVRTLGSRASFSPSSCSAPSGSLPTACLTHGVVPASGQCRSQPARACPSPAVRTQHTARAGPQ